MKNVTITADSNLVSWAKLAAAKNGKSLSAFIVGLLKDAQASFGNSTQDTLEAFNSFKPRAISKKGSRAFKREEIYE